MFGSVFCFLSFFIIELNAGPTDRDSCYNFSIFHWNSNSITGHNFAKLNPLHACYAIHKLDIICLSESFLDLSVPSNNDNLYRKDQKVVGADHPGKIKRGAGWIYLNEPLLVRCLLNPYLKECLFFKMSTSKKIGYVVPFYRSPRQTSDDFNSFRTNLEKFVVNTFSSNPHFILIIGHFNAKSSNWSSNDTATAGDAHLD